MCQLAGKAHLTANYLANNTPTAQVSQELLADMVHTSSEQIDSTTIETSVLSQPKTNINLADVYHQLNK